MFATLLESGARRDRREGSISLSALLHVALMAGGVLLTSERVVEIPEVIPDTIFFIQPRRPLPAQRDGPTDAGGMPSAPRVDPTTLVLSEIPLDGEFQTVDTFPSSAIGGEPEGNPLAEPSGSGLFAAATVEKTALPLPGNRSPAYPEMLRAAGIEGSALMQFVIDTAGIVEPSSITILRTDHELFATAARRALLRHRFLPAEVAGHKVRMLVEQRFEFAIERR